VGFKSLLEHKIKKFKIILDKRLKTCYNSIMNDLKWEYGRNPAYLSDKTQKHK